MAKKRKAAPAAGNPDNLYTLRVAGEDVECIASLGASEVYREEFIGKLEHPYTGVLEDDLLAIHHCVRPIVAAAVEVDGDGNPIVGEDGDPVVRRRGDGRPVEVTGDYDAPCVAVPNPDYRGRDMVAVLRFVWAMARAAGAMAEGWAEWSARVMASPMGVAEQKRVFDKALYEVAYKHWFLDGDGQVGAEERDAPQEAEAVAAHDGGEDVA